MSAEMLIRFLAIQLCALNVSLFRVDPITTTQTEIATGREEVSVSSLHFKPLC
jgi:hypothetical protein